VVLEIRQLRQCLPRHLFFLPTNVFKLPMLNLECGGRRPYFDLSSSICNKIVGIDKLIVKFVTTSITIKLIVNKIVGTLIVNKIVGINELKLST
jgi:hypothetical protein